MDDVEMDKLVDLVFAAGPTAAQLGPGALDAVESLVRAQAFDEFGRRVFRALVMRSLATLQARRTVAVARLNALLERVGPLQ